MTTIRFKRGPEYYLNYFLLNVGEPGFTTDTQALFVGNGISNLKIASTELFTGNSIDAHFHDSDRSRANHTGLQLASTISDFDNSVTNLGDLRYRLLENEILVSEISGLQTSLDSYQALSEKGIANGYASLDSSGTVPVSQLPSMGQESIVVATITDRDNLTDLFSGLRAHVLDATADTSVASGAAGYIYDGSVWQKIYEEESLDLVIDWDLITNKPSQYPDSALLDGLDSTQFLRSDIDATFTGNLTIGPNNKALRFKDTDTSDHTALRVDTSNVLLVGSTNQPTTVQGSPVLINGLTPIVSSDGLVSLTTNNVVFHTAKTFSFAATSYFQSGEYAILCSITPGGSSRNYNVTGCLNIAAADASLIQFEWRVRSNTLPEILCPVIYTRLNKAWLDVDLFTWYDETNATVYLVAKNSGVDAHNVSATFEVFMRADYRTDFDFSDTVTVTTIVSNAVETQGTEVTYLETLEDGTLGNKLDIRLDGATDGDVITLGNLTNGQYANIGFKEAGTDEQDYFYISGPGAATEAVKINGAGVLTVTSTTNNVGVDLYNPDAGCYIRFHDDNATGYYLGTKSGEFYINDTSNNNKFKIDTSGNVLIYNHVYMSRSNPCFIMTDTGTNTSGRLVVTSTATYLQAGAVGAGNVNSSSGNVLVTGYAGADVASFAVRKGGTDYEVLTENDYDAINALTYATPLIATDDLNSLSDGWYTWATTPVNSPTAYGVMLQQSDPNQKVQLVFGGGDYGKMYVRRADSGTFYAWTEFLSSTSLSGSFVLSDGTNHTSDITIRADDRSVIFQDSTDTTTNWLWRNYADGNLYIGGENAKPVFRANVSFGAYNAFLANNKLLYGYNTGGSTYSIAGINTANNVQIGSNSLPLTFLSNGTVTVNGTVSISKLLIDANGITLNNNAYLYGKTTTDVTYAIGAIDTSNHVRLGSGSLPLDIFSSGSINASGILTVTPSSVSGRQPALILKDLGGGAGEGCYIQWGQANTADLARIGARSATAVTTGDTGYLDFSTKSSGESTPSVKMTLDSGGNLHINGHLYINGVLTINDLNGFHIQDTRDDVSTTDFGARGIYFDFKRVNTNGLNPGGAYYGEMTFQQWTDSSGGYIHQLAFGLDGLHFRNATIGSTWNDWKKVLLDGDAVPATWLTSMRVTNANIADTAGVTAYYLHSTATNRPAGNEHVALTLSYSDAYSFQLAGDWATNYLYTRGQVNTSWGTWKRLLNEDDIGSVVVSTTDGSANAPFKISGVGGHIQLVETDAADPNDYYLIEVNAGNLNYYFRDNSASSWTLLMRYASNGTITIPSGDLLVTAGNIQVDSGTDSVAINNGYIELAKSAANAYIDFKSSESEDFDCRIIQSSNGLVFHTGGNGSALAGLEITSARDVKIPRGNLTITDTASQLVMYDSDDPVDTNDYTFIDRNANQTRIYFRDNSAALSRPLLLMEDSGNVSVSSGNLTVNQQTITQTLKILSNTQSTTCDLYLTANANIAAEANMYFFIDSLNNGNTDAFYFRKNASYGAGVDLMTIQEDGEVIIYDSLSVNNNFEVDSAGARLNGSDIVIVDQVSNYNYIINGDFLIWNRGLSQTDNGYGSDDRWVNNHYTATKTHERVSFTFGQTDVPGNPLHYSQTTFTTANYAAEYVLKQQKIENVSTFSGETVTFSFYAKMDATKNIAIEFRQEFGTGGSAGITTNVVTKSISTSWTRYSVTVTLPSVAGKTIGDGSYMYVSFWLTAGSNWNDRTNSLGTQSGVFSVANVKLEKSSVATPFIAENIERADKLCKRYYNNFENQSLIFSCDVTSGGNYHWSIFYPTMRSIPAVSLTASSILALNSSTFSAASVGISTLRLMCGATSSGRCYIVYFVELNAEL